MGPQAVRIEKKGPGNHLSWLKQMVAMLVSVFLTARLLFTVSDRSEIIEKVT